MAGIGRRSRSRRDYTADVTQTLVPQPQDCDALQRGAEPPHGESPHGPSFSFSDFAGAGQLNLCVPNVTPQRVHALVSRLIGHLEDGGAARGSAGQKT